MNHRIKGSLTPFCACAALIRRTSFQSWYLWEKSFSIDLTRRVKIVIPTFKDCLVIYERFKRHTSVFWVEYRRELRCPREGVFEATRDKNYFRKKKEKKKTRRKDGGKDIGNYIAAVVHASWKKVKCLCLYCVFTHVASSHVDLLKQKKVFT